MRMSFCKKRLGLVPYLEHHVPRYHQWLSDPELLEATCSEPLSLQEEYDNQKTWLASSDKPTFILLAPLCTVLSATGLQLASQAGEEDERRGGEGLVSTGTDFDLGSSTTSKNKEESVDSATKHPLDQTYVMIGDCNLFVPPYVRTTAWK